MQKKVIEGYRLSAQQKQLWLMQHDSQQFSSQCAIIIEGDLSTATLKSALQILSSRHEILRTTFGCVAGIDLPVQVVNKDIDIPYEDAFAADINQSAQDCIAMMIEEDNKQIFDFEQGPLVRFRLVRLSQNNSILLISMSALCGDARTLSNLMNELSLYYAACLDGDSILDEPIQYVQFSEWQNESVESEEGEPGREYWRKRETQTNADIKLPLERSGRQGEFSGAETLSVEVSRELGERIKSEAHKYDCSLNLFFLACWQMLLWRLTGNSDAVVYSFFDGRRFKELHAALGLYGRYLPVSCRLENTLRFSDLLTQIKKVANDCNEWQEYFPVQSRSRSGLQSDPASRIAFDFHQMPGEVSTPRTRSFMSYLYSCSDLFKLRLSVTQEAASFSYRIHYDQYSYSKAGMARLADEYVSVLKSVVNNSRDLLINMDVLGVNEREQLLSQAKQTREEYAQDSCIHVMFENQVKLRPDETAVLYGNDNLTFSDLNRRANQLAHYLINNGVKIENIIGILMGRSVDLMVAVLGIIKSGAAYLPLDTAQPGQRTAFIIKDAGVSTVITQKGLERGPVKELQGVDFVDIDDAEMSSQKKDDPNRPVTAKNLAYVIYTSGSTGKPKGVMIEHRSIVNLVNSLKKIYCGDQQYRSLSVNAPLAFDGSVKQLMQVVNGHRLSIVPEEVRRDGEAMLSYLEKSGIDVLDCTPGQLNLLLRAGIESNDSGYPSTVVVGGEAIDQRMWQRLASSDKRRYYNFYGPTECTVDATVCQITNPLDTPRIGRPIANAQVYVLDEQERIVPIGVTGEIHIGGEGVGRGYLRRADLTAEKFIPNNFTDQHGARLYKTGDIGKYLEDGSIEYVGRKDHQVKIRGNRVELGEIEAILEQHRGVEKAVVITREDQAGEQSLVGYALAARRYRATINGKARYYLPNGMAIAQQNKNETDYLYDEIFNKQTYLKYGISIPENACVFDVGANIGLFTLFVSQRFPAARIYAFEPIEPIFETLQINTELYRGNVKLFQVGLSDKEKTAAFAYYPEYSMMSGLKAYSDATGDVEVIKRYLSNEIQKGETDKEVLLNEAEEILAGRFRERVVEGRLARLSQVIQREGVERIDLLKVDVQRAEMDVLKGIDEKDWDKIEQVVMEVHDQAGTRSQGRVEQITNMLKRHGFEAVVEQDALLADTDRFNIYAARHKRLMQSGNGKYPEVAELLPVMNVQEQRLTRNDLRDYLKERLPEYMIPATLLIVDDLPLTRNGKVDRQALPSPEQVERDSQSQLRGPNTQFEEMLASIWSELLGVERIGAADNFFDQGGHSILATQLVSRVREVFRVELPLRIVFDSPALEAQAKAIQAAKSAEAGVVLPRLRRVDRNKPIPLSFAQQRLWFLNQLEMESAFYNCPSATRFKGPLNIGALEHTVNEIVRRHEVLRTTFTTKQGNPLQIIHPPLSQGLPVIDLTEIPEQDREIEASGIADEEAQSPFDLSKGPVFRVKLVKMANDHHIVLFTMHHIVADGWSVRILMREIQAIYESFSNNLPSPLPDVEIQYADYACWQRDWLQAEVVAQQMSYWKTHLAGATSILELPTDRPRPPVLTFRGASLPVALSESLAGQLRILSRREGASLFMTLLAAFQTLLSRYTGQKDIIVGSPIAGRNTVELENLIGFFINTLALRTDLSGNPSFSQLLGRARQVTLEAYTHQDLPFEKLVEELNPERSLSHTPLFQVALGFQHSSNEEFRLSGLDLSSAQAQGVTAKFDLVLTMVDTGNWLTGALRYNTDLFDHTTIARWLSNFETMLKNVAGNPDQPISTLPILTAAELHQLLVEWKDTAVEYRELKCLHEMFVEEVERNPFTIAATFEKERITYAELDRRANQLAHYLISLGVGPDVLVGIYLERSIDLIVALLGVFKAGGAYVPLDPAYPLERLAFMLEDTLAPVVITQERLIESLPSHWGEVVSIDGQRAELAKQSKENPEIEVAGENLAYVIYTSGSTGKPKGVMITHRGLSDMAEAQVKLIGLIPSDRVLQFSSFNFDASIFEIAFALRTGATLVMANQDSLLPGQGLIDLLRKQAVTFAVLPPSVLAALPKAELPALRTLLIAGEVCSADLVKRWTGKRKVFNAYGPTEVTIWTTLAQCVDAERKPSIGRPVTSAGVYLLDEYLQPVPIGVPGEIHIDGIRLARGYLHRPELTAQKFVPNPLSNEPGARLYKTGDLARYLPDGDIDFLGRLDYQVKVRGYRIELEEIESVMSKHPAVAGNVVMTRPGAEGENTLVAFLVCDRKGGCSTSEMRNFLKDQLPEYMVPSTLVFLDALPLTPNGKVDHKALLSLERDRPDLDEPFIEPRTELEYHLAKEWQEILDLQRAGVKDNFFDLGGDSIKAAVLINRIQEQLGEIVQIVSIFDAPTIASYAEYLNEHYPNATARLCATDGSTPTDHFGHETLNANDRIDLSKVEQMRQLIKLSSSRAAGKSNGTIRSRAAVFILSPPRSGSTLLRVMLGGHSSLFAPPELELLTFNTLEERKAAFTGRASFWLEGTIRAIMQIKGCNADRAKEIMEEFEDKKLSTREFYAQLQDWIGGKKLVDKTPSYVLDPDVLGLAETYFENPFYIHLVRGPYATIRSYEEARINHIFPRFPHPFSQLQVAELIWLISHENILQFLKTVPRNRQFQIKFEDLLEKPKEILDELCKFLGIEFEPDMMEPYKDKQAQMTDGIYEQSLMLGDVKFHQHKGIEAEVANKWKSYYRQAFLGAITLEMASQLGYERPEFEDTFNRPERTILTKIPPVSIDPEVDRIASRLNHLTEEEIDSLLRRELSQGQID